MRGTFTTLDLQPYDAHFSVDGTWLVTSVLHLEVGVGNVGQFSTFVWDVSGDEPKLVIDLKDFKHPSLSADGQRLAAFDTQDGSLHVFDVSSLPAKLLLKLPGVTMDNELHHVQPRHGFLGDGTLAVLDKAYRLSVWDVSAAQPKLIAERDFTKEHLGSEEDGLRPFRTGQPRLLQHNQGGIQSWRIEKSAIEPEFTRRFMYEIPWSNTNGGDVALSLDGRTAISTHLNGMVKLYEITDEGFRERHPIHQQPIFANNSYRVLHVSPDGRHLATGAENGTQVWRLSGPTCQPLTIDESDPLSNASPPLVFWSSSITGSSSRRTFAQERRCWRGSREIGSRLWHPSRTRILGPSPLTSMASCSVSNREHRA